MPVLPAPALPVPPAVPVLACSRWHFMRSSPVSVSHSPLERPMAASGRVVAPLATQLVVGLIAVVLATVNMVGGFVVTDRMLQMFTRKKAPKKEAAA